MKAFRSFHLILVVFFLAALIAVPANSQSCITTCPAGATCIAPQDDTWTTLTTTQVDFSNFGNVNLSSLLGGTPTSTVVNFNGKPLSSSLGSADTLLSRGLVSISGANYSACLSLKGLHLASTQDIQIQGGDTFSVDVVLSNQSGTGQLSFTQTSSDGGTYSSSFTVTPLITFTDTSNPGAPPIQVDCASSTYSCSFPMAGGGNYLFTSQSGFDPQSQGIPAVPSGVQVGGYTTVGRARYGGIQVGCGGTKSAGYHCNNNDQKDELHGILGQANGHDIQPPNDCGSSSSGGGGTGGGSVGPSPRLNATKVSTSSSTGTDLTGTGGTDVATLCSTTISQ